MIAAALIKVAIAGAIGFGCVGFIVIMRHIARFVIGLFTNEELRGAR